MKTLLKTAVLASVAFTPLAVLADAVSETPFQFKLRSHEGREWASQDFDDHEIVVVAFLGTECPLVKLYGPRLQLLNAEFGDKVAVIGINSNTQDSMTEMTAYAERHGVQFPLLKDVGNKVADQFKAARTPEVFLLDSDRRVRYHGQIDDQYDVGIVRDKAERNFLRDAIEEVLAGKKVSLPETEAIGCHIGRVNKVEPTGDITYTKQISRIFNARCVECHRDGELAPFTLTSYDDVLGWEDTICEVIEDNRMPPWFANPKHGKFKNDCRLSEEEKQLVYTWVDNGMPEGDPADLPEPRKFDKGWRIPKPDQVFHMDDKSFNVQAQGTIDYQHFVVDPEWDEDMYIKAAEARPDNKSVVHHILVYVVPPGERFNGGRLDKVLVGYAPGSLPVLLQEGVAIEAKAGSKLLFQMHYTPNGYEEVDRSYVGVKFVDKKDVKKLISGKVAIEDDFRIPARADNHVVTAEYESVRDELLVSMTPHMHLRGKAFKYEAIYPNGDQEVLLDVPKYDFNWQIKYILEEPKLLPRGTTIQCTAVYDNSESNPVNPNPNRAVGWGDQSWQEMMIGFFDTLPPDEGETTAVVRKKSNPSIDPTGVYSWKRGLPGKLTLEMKDDFLVGKLESRGKEFEIEDAIIEGDNVRFSVDAGRMFLKFDAKVTKDAIRGTINMKVASVGRGGEIPWTGHKE